MQKIQTAIQKAKQYRPHSRKEKVFVGAIIALALALGLAVVLRFTNASQVGEAGVSDNNAKFGFAMGNVANKPELINHVKSAGAKKMRTTFAWSTEQPSGPNDPIGKYREMAQRAQSEGISILGVLAFAPNWAQNTECKQRYAGKDLADERQKCEPRSAREFGIWAGKMAAYYKQYGIHQWEIWNEPNITAFWKDKDGQPNPKLYTEVVKNAYNNIKWFDGTATVVIGGLAPIGEYRSDANTTQIDPRAFLQQMYIYGLDNQYDALGFHPYTFAAKNRPDFDEVGTWWTMYKDSAGIKSIRTIMNELGAGSKKIWVTEYGFITAKTVVGGTPRTFSQDDQVWSMRNAVNLWKSYPWAGNFYYFEHEDSRAPTTATISIGTSHGYFGVKQKTNAAATCNGLTPGGSAKKSYCWYKRFLNDPYRGWAPLELSLSSSSRDGVTVGVCKVPSSNSRYTVRSLVGRTSANASHSSMHYQKDGNHLQTDATKIWFNDKLQVHEVKGLLAGDSVKTNVRMKSGELYSFGQVPAGSTSPDYVSVANINSFCD
jgi:polysaccharide biosynthesis protein PslG